MDRRQLLFGVTALGLVANLDFNQSLIAQVGDSATSSRRLSDRERDHLRGAVKTCSEFIGNETESMSEAEYAADGRLTVWRGRTFTGSVERVYSYDGSGRLISIISGGSGVTDEVRYDEQGKKVEVRTVSPRPGQQRNMATGVEIMFEVAEEGNDLNAGGSVTTRYNDDDQPVESLVRDSHGLLLTRIVHNYENGRLVNETLVKESLDLPEEFGKGPSGEQLSEQQLRAIRAQMKEMLSQRGLDRMERSYFYDNQGHVARRLTVAGNFRQETIPTYNEHGDEGGIVTIQSGSPWRDDPKPARPESERSEIHYLYEYDAHGNWTERSTAGGSDSTASHRKLTYY